MLNSKEIRHAREGKQLDTLGAIRQLINICSHPKLLLDTYYAKKQCNEPVSEELVALVEIIQQYNSAHSNASASGRGAGAGSSSSGNPGIGFDFLNLNCCVLCVAGSSSSSIASNSIISF